MQSIPQQLGARVTIKADDGDARLVTGRLDTKNDHGQVADMFDPIVPTGYDAQAATDGKIPGMGDNVIPLADMRYAAPVPLVPSSWPQGTERGVDALGRRLHDLRISVTDRCNFRCGYCMPKEVFGRDYAFLPQSSLLTFEEITRLARIFVSEGVRKIRLTGGEPLLRKNLETLIGMLAGIVAPDGEHLDLTLTTNGSLLKRKAAGLASAGLRRITVSLDGLDDAVFRRMNDVDFPVADVLAGIEAAVESGLTPVKVNMVVKRGTNDHEILPMARHFRDRFGERVVLRFIEYMDVGATNGWRMEEVLPSTEVRTRLHQAFPLEPMPPQTAGETAQRWRYQDGRGEVGFISSVTQAFCSECNRARLSTEGKLFLCLFASQGHDLRALLRGRSASGAAWSDEQIASAIAQVWSHRRDRYSELRSSNPPRMSDQGRVEMHYIGG